jgi:chromate reductase, NAD(P)H dehydrogenase (quinone)
VKQAVAGAWDMVRRQVFFELNYTMQHKTIKILAISGSLRSNSSNHTIIHAAAAMMPANVAYIIYTGLGQLPHFNDEQYDAVAEWKKQISEADGILICTPEYAFGVPGSLKNALDWTVGTGDLCEKPVALITASSVGDKAHASLQQTLTALTATMNEETTLLIPFIRSKFNERGELDEATARSIQKVLAGLLELVDQKQKGT